MDIKEEGKILLETHLSLYNSLIKIPEEREIIYREDIESKQRIGKPRFDPAKYKWKAVLLKKLRNHLQSIWIFFDKYSYWLDDTILPLLTYKERRMSKKSIIFLLEEDIWNTDEIYGDYLIEKDQNETTVSYIRRDKKIKQFHLNFTSDKKIKDWICSDAINQIKNQFNYLWSKLGTEIKVCKDEEYHKEPKLQLKSEYLNDQLKMTIKISNDWPESGLLSLGRIAELWLLIVLNKKNKNQYEDIIRAAEVEGFINQHQRKILNKIKRHYNNVKHKLTYKCEKDMVIALIDEFSSLLL